jgi:uncharacterized membrane protein YphA (DoxX/SURF4 family)
MRRWIGVLVRVVLGGIFLYAGLIKASDSQQFALALVPFTFLPVDATGFLAVFIAWSEVVAGVLILLPRIYLLGAAMIAALCVVFIGVLSWALWNGIVIPCPCFGGDAPPSASAMVGVIMRDVVLLLAAGALPYLGKRE